MDDLATRIRIDDPSWYLQDDAHVMFDEARRDAPVLFYPELNTFLLTRHDDISDVSRTPGIFSSAQGMLLNDAKYGNIASSFFPDGAELITATDPPRHRELRRVIQPTFSAVAVANFEPLIREHCKSLVASIEPGVEIDFVEKMAIPLPIRMICEVLGIEGAPEQDVREWTDQMERMGGDLTHAELTEISNSLEPMNQFLMQALERKRGTTGDNLLSTLLQAEIDNEKLTDMNVLMLTVATMVAGNGTTRALLGDTIFTLAQHPQARADLVQDPSLIPSAINEVLRFVTPVAGFLRTSVEDTEIRGTTIKAGQYVYMSYMAANRDEEVFIDPHSFDVRRGKKVTHLSFGTGEHACPGNSLARLEAHVFMDELLKRFPDWTITGEVEPIMSIMTNGFERLPVTFEEADADRTSPE